MNIQPSTSLIEAVSRFAETRQAVRPVTPRPDARQTRPEEQSPEPREARRGLSSRAVRKLVETNAAMEQQMRPAPIRFTDTGEAIARPAARPGQIIDFRV